MSEKFVVYYRVSTNKQGKSGLGLDAQKKTVMDFLNGHGYEIAGELTEIESGGKDDRPELKKAVAACHLKKARLIVAKLDRLSRDLGFITQLQKSGVRFVVAEMPDATELTIHIYAALAQHERKLIGQRTKQALEAAKERGVQLGNPCLRRGEQIPGSGDTEQANEARIAKADDFAQAVSAVIEEIKTQGAASLRQIACKLNDEGYKTAKGGVWHATSVARILKRVHQQHLPCQECDSSDHCNNNQ